MSDEADAVTVRDDDFGRGRVLASLTHGQYVTSMNMSRGEAERLRDALSEYLEPITHLMAGHANDDGTVTVTSVITLCCKVAFPKGLGTLDPTAVTCPAQPNRSE